MPTVHGTMPGKLISGKNSVKRPLNLRKTTDKALLVVCGCNLFEWGTFLRRMDNFLMDLMCDQYNVEKLLDQLMIRHLATLEKVCNAVGDIVDIIRFGDDLGMSFRTVYGILKFTGSFSSQGIRYYAIM